MSPPLPCSHRQTEKTPKPHNKLLTQVGPPTECVGAARWWCGFPKRSLGDLAFPCVSGSPPHMCRPHPSFRGMTPSLMCGAMKEARTGFMAWRGACVLGGAQKLCVYCQRVGLWPRLRHHCCGVGRLAHHEVKVRPPSTVYLNFLLLPLRSSDSFQQLWSGMISACRRLLIYSAWGCQQRFKNRVMLNRGWFKPEVDLWPGLRG